MRYLRLALAMLVVTGCATHVARRPAAVRPASAPPAAVAQKPAAPVGAAKVAAVSQDELQSSAAQPQPAWLRGTVSRAGSAAPRVVVVLGFRGPIEHWALEIMSDEARTAALEAVREHGYTVVGGATAQAIVESPRRGAATCAGAACDIEAARRAGAELVLLGEVTRLDQLRVGTLKLYETSTGAIVNSARFGGGTPAELIEKTYSASASLFK